MMNINKYLSYSLLIFPLIMIFSQGLTNIYVALIATLLFIYIFIKKKYFIFKKKYFISFIIYCIYLIFLSITSNNPYLSLETSLFFFRFIFFSFGVLLILNFDDKLINKLFYIVTTCLIFISIDGIFQFIFGFNFFFYERIWPDRIGGVFNDELILGSFISRIFPIFLFLYFSNIQYKNKIFSTFNIVLIFCITLFLIAIIVSGDRVAVLYYLFSLTILFIAYKKIRKSILLTLIISSLFIFIISIFDSSLKYRYIERTLYNDFQIQNGLFNMNFFTNTHEQHYLTAISIFKENIFFGAGPKLFRFECQNFKELYFHGCSTHPHNTYLQLLSETGLIGTMPIIIIFAFLIYFLFKSIFITNFKSQDYNNNNIFFIILFLIPLLPLIPSSNFFSSYLNSLYFFGLGIFMYNNRERL